MIAWSYGGGTQTAAIAALVLQGKLPRPDVVVMADTGRELASTWDYLHEVVGPALAAVGLTVQIAPHSLAKVDLFSYGGELLLPAFTRAGVGVGKLRTWCSDEWKKQVVRRWLRAQGVEDCDNWIGISTDESERMKDSDVLWCRNVYPLIELVPTSRAGCVAIVEKMGWPAPPKSRCWMCPNQSGRDWLRMRDEQPSEWAKAVALDDELRQMDPYVYLHRAGVPLPQAVAVDDLQGGLFDGCDSGYCFV